MTVIPIDVLEAAVKVANTISPKLEGCETSTALLALAMVLLTQLKDDRQFTRPATDQEKANSVADLVRMMMLELIETPEFQMMRKQ